MDICIDGKRQYLGYHATEEEAARAYDSEGARLGRELNFPKGKRTASSSFEGTGIIGDGDGAPPSSSEYSEGGYANAAVEGDAKGLQPKESPKRRKRIRTCKL